LKPLLAFPDEGEVSQTMEEYFDLATTWLQGRRLDLLHLKGGPRIWFWTDGTKMFIRWDNSDLTLEGHNEWASTKGTYSMPLETFIEEVRSFDRRLIEAMEERVQAIRCSWDRPTIRIDKDSVDRTAGTGGCFVRSVSASEGSSADLME
jgi:Family of unknown function (DUF5984)